MLLFDKLIELTETRKYDNVKIGSGISYFYCGDYDTQIIDTLNDIGCWYIKDAKKKIKLKKTQILKEDSVFKKRQLKRQIAKLQKYIDNFIPFIARNVKETRDGISQDEPNTLIIIISGNELGKYWTIKEFKEYYGSNR